MNLSDVGEKQRVSRSKVFRLFGFYGLGQTNTFATIARIRVRRFTLKDRERICWSFCTRHGTPGLPGKRRRDTSDGDNHCVTSRLTTVFAVWVRGTLCSRKTCDRVQTGELQQFQELRRRRRRKSETRALPPSWSGRRHGPANQRVPLIYAPSPPTAVAVADNTAVIVARYHAVVRQYFAADSHPTSCHVLSAIHKCGGIIKKNNITLRNLFGLVSSVNKDRNTTSINE